MTAPSRPQGVYCPVVTPFNRALQPDHERYVRHCRWLVSEDVGLAVFGTNSEANSMSVGEKKALLDTLAGAGLPRSRIIAGTGCAALTDTVELSAHAVKLGCPHVLMLPPFYYKNVSDDGLFRHYAEVIERVGADALRIYLYHIPQVSQVPLSVALIERLLDAYPQTMAGIKDSSGDWRNTQTLLERFQPRGFDVFAGSESFLLATLRAGGAGCITGMGNVNPAAIVELYRHWQAHDADTRQQALDTMRGTFSRFPMIPALKATIGLHMHDPEWGIVRPPLVALDETQRVDLEQALSKTGFAMPNLMTHAHHA